MRKIFFFLLTSLLPFVSMANKMQINDSISDREALGFSNKVKSVFIDEDKPREYTFNKQGDIIKSISEVDKYTWYVYNTYDSGLLVEKINLWTYREYVTYQYNEQKQLIKKRTYRTVPYFYIDSLGDMYCTYDSSRYDLKQRVNEGKLKMQSINTYYYNSAGKLIKKERKNVNYNPMSRVAMYGAAKDITTRYLYNKNGQLKKTVKKAPSSRVRKSIEISKYNDNHQEVSCKRIWRRRWYNFLFNREVSTYSYSYDENKRLIKRCYLRSGLKEA